PWRSRLKCRLPRLGSYLVNHRAYAWWHELVRVFQKATGCLTDLVPSILSYGPLWYSRLPYSLRQNQLVGFGALRETLWSSSVFVAHVAALVATGRVSLAGCLIQLPLGFRASFACRNLPPRVSNVVFEEADSYSRLPCLGGAYRSLRPSSSEERRVGEGSSAWASAGEENRRESWR